MVLHLRPDEDEFLEDFRLRSIIRKFSDHIAVPIVMPKLDSGAQAEEGETVIPEEEPVNQGSALWMRNKSEIRRVVAKGLALKFAPEIRFAMDETYDRMDDTRRLLSMDRVRRDLEDD